MKISKYQFEINEESLTQLLAYSDRYDITIQFWAVGLYVFIEKDGIDLKNYGGDDAIDRALRYLNRINTKQK